MTNEYNLFRQERSAASLGMSRDQEFKRASAAWQSLARKHGYSYNFEFAGRPLIQYPQDMVSVQEIIWQVRPDLIIETGIAHGGSIIQSASMLALLDLADSINIAAEPQKFLIEPRRKVIGIDIDIRTHNLLAIESHPFFPWVELIEGSSVDGQVVEKVQNKANVATCVLVLLDSNHTHKHVKKELELYSPFVTLGSYAVVFDTVIETLENADFPDRPWGIGNNPMTAVQQFLKGNSEFVVAFDVEAKLGISSAPSGYLRRVADAS